MPRFCANLTFLFTELDPLDRFAAAAAAGFTGVEMHFPYAHPPAEIRKRLDDNGLELVTFNLPAGDWEAGSRGFAAVPGMEGEFRDGLARGLEYADALGVSLLHPMAGIPPAGTDPDDALRVYEDNLAFAAAKGGRGGIRFAIEPINQRDMPGYFLANSAQARAVIDAVGMPNLGLLFDIYHAQVEEGGLSQIFRDSPVFHIQVAAEPGRHEPPTGEIAYDFLFALFDAEGYDGWIGCEYHPAGATADGLGWLRPHGLEPRAAGQ